MGRLLQRETWKSMMASSKPPTYKALILDLDGTTIPMAGELPSERVIRCVQEVIKKGVHVVVATGRIRQRALPAIEALGITDPCIFYNGAQLYHMGEQKILYQHCIHVTQVLEFLKIFQGKKIELSSEEGKQEFVIPPQNLEKLHIFGCYVPHLTRIEAEQYMKKLSAFSHLKAIMATQTWDGLPVVGVTHVDATKQEAISHVINYFKIDPEEMVAVGDGENDMPMIIAAGMGVAMGNAVGSLKEMANYIAPTVEEDGVAHVIEKFFF